MGKSNMSKSILRLSGPLLVLALVLPVVGPVFAEDKPAVIQVTNLVGAEALKSGAKAKWSVQDGTLKLEGKIATANIKISSIENVYTATEATQAGGNYGSAAHVGAMAAPYGSGAALTLILWTKIDLLTVLYRGETGGLHSVLLAVPKGKAEPLRAQLIAAGAHAEGKK
jgi:ribosome-associated protein YbcJ (S4-like RNA binding protein)